MAVEPKLESAIYVGHVEHDRYTPRRNRFQYRIHHLYLDLDELPSLFERHPLWSFEKRNIVSFRRSDYIGDESIPLNKWSSTVSKKNWAFALAGLCDC